MTDRAAVEGQVSVKKPALLFRTRAGRSMLVSKTQGEGLACAHQWDTACTFTDVLSESRTRHRRFSRSGDGTAHHRTSSATPTVMRHSCSPERMHPWNTRREASPPKVEGVAHVTP